jgi:S1-C subfamily serine protease
VGGLIVWLVNRSPDEAPKAENRLQAVENAAQAQPAAGAPRPAPQPLAQLPQGPKPSNLDPDALRKVKQATVYLRVDLPNGSAAEGSGFLCAAPGIVVTNAHVLGMLRSDSLPPTRVQVVLHSGETGEKKTTATVLGVDRTNDLAVLHLPDDLRPLPEPLPVDSAATLVETQKVYVFGFPLGAQLGKNITVSESSVSSLRRDDNGVLSQVQVNGGMHPGNSGGPVTDTRGAVVGVSVSGYRGTQIQFAIPGDLVQQVLDGRFATAELGTAYQSDNQVLLPVKLTCLDPLGKVRELKVEVGTGAAGEGPRTAHAAVFRDGAYNLDVPMPSAWPGRQGWLQPVLVRSSGQTERVKAVAIPADSQTVLQRKPALLQFKPPHAGTDRTLQLDSDVALTFYQGKSSATLREKMAGKVLESLRPDPRGIGTSIRLTLADCPFTREAGDKKQQPPPQTRQLLSQFSPTFLVDAGNACKERGKRNFNVLAPNYRSTVESMYETVCNTYESTTLPLPNRTVQPRESWPARMPMLVLAGGKRQVQDIFVTCTYEGVHATTDGLEAHIALSGVVKGRGARSSLSLGKARGHARFHVEKGFLTLVHLTVRTEVENEDADVRLLVNDQSIVRRREGNQLGIAAATRNQPGAPPPRTQPGVPPRGQARTPQAGTGPAQPVKPTSSALPAPRPSHTPKGEELSRLVADLKSPDEAVREHTASILQQTQALKTMDARAAEKAVLPLLTDGSVFVRCAAVKLLADVGARDSIAPLERLAQENNVFHSGLARQALASIRNRAGIDRPTPPPASNEPTSGAKPSGLLAYWSFEEGEGVQAADASGNALHARLVKAGWTDGIRGKGLRLSGPGSYLDYGDSPHLSFAAQAPFSIAFWTRTTRPRGMLLSQRHDRDGSAVIDISIGDGKAKAQVRQDGNDVFGPTEVVSGTISNGEWHHLVLTREGDHIELFLDGVSQGRKRGNMSGGAITTDLRALGAELYWLRHFTFGDPHFEGDMDEFCIFDRVLKANEIAALALR